MEATFQKEVRLPLKLDKKNDQDKEEQTPIHISVKL